MSELTNDLNWLKTHVLLLAIVGVLVLGGIYGVESLIARCTADNDAKWNVLLQQQTQQTQAIESKLQADETTWSQQNAVYQSTIRSLVTTISNRDAQTKTQVQQDSNLSTQDASAKIAAQTKSLPGEVTTQGNNVVVDLPVARTIVQGLDQLPTLQADIDDAGKQLTAQQKIDDNLQADLNAKAGLIQSLQTENTTQQKACDAKVADVKAKARKSKLKWFGIGYVLGLVSAHFVGI